MKTIVINVSRKAAVTIRTAGFVGESCRQASEPFERALGSVSSDVATEDAYATNTIDAALSIDAS